MSQYSYVHSDCEDCWRTQINEYALGKKAATHTGPDGMQHGAWIYDPSKSANALDSIVGMRQLDTTQQAIAQALNTLKNLTIELSDVETLCEYANQLAAVEESLNYACKYLDHARGIVERDFQAKAVLYDEEKTHD